MKSYKDLELALLMARIFKNKRLECELSQDDLAFAIGLTRVSIANIESGQQGITLMTLFKSAKAFGINPCELLPKDFTVEIRDRNTVLRQKAAKKLSSLQQKIKDLQELEKALTIPTI